MTAAQNTVENNRSAGILLFGMGTATIVQNTVNLNPNGIVLDINSTAEIRDNTIVGNTFREDFPPGFRTGNGISVHGGSVARITGGSISDNHADGIYVAITPLPPHDPGKAMVGLDGDSVLEITNNGGAGIHVEEDGSEATVDSRNIIFNNNAEGDIVGNVIDVAPAP